jgi:hypothetical protein
MDKVRANDLSASEDDPPGGLPNEIDDSDQSGNDSEGAQTPRDDSDSQAGDISSLTRNLSSSSLLNVEYSVKHPLQHSWTWWYDCTAGSTTARSWTNKLCKVYTVDTVEDFWRYAVSP